jgi:hypothetical protein
VNFGRLKLFSEELGNSQLDLPLVEFEQVRGDVLRGVQVLEFVLGDIRELLAFSLVDDAVLETSAGVIQLRPSDLRYAGEILRYTTTLWVKSGSARRHKLLKARKERSRKNVVECKNILVERNDPHFG